MAELYVDIIDIDILPLQTHEFFCIKPVRLTHEIIDRIERNFKDRLATSPNDRTPRHMTWTEEGWQIDNDRQGWRDLYVIVIEGYREKIFHSTPIRIASITDLRLFLEFKPQIEYPIHKPRNRFSHGGGYRLRRHLNTNPERVRTLSSDHFKLAQKEFDYKFYKCNRRSKHQDPLAGEIWSWHESSTSSWKNTKCRHQWQRHL